MNSILRLALICSGGLMAAQVDAQTAQDLSGIKVEPSTSAGPAVDVDLGIKPITPDQNVIKLPSEWARFAGGVWTGMLGQGVFGTLPRVSTDSAFANASERGLGFGVQMDLGVKHSAAQALRFRLGYASLNVKPDAETLQMHAASRLESRIKMVHTSLFYRWSWLSYPQSGVVWVGAGASLNYVTDTVPADLTLAPESKLLNTMGVGYQAVLGWDYPIYKYTDLGLEVGYHPFRSVSMLLSLRTSL